MTSYLAPRFLLNIHMANCADCSAGWDCDTRNDLADDYLLARDAVIRTAPADFDDRPASMIEYRARRTVANARMGVR